MKRNAKVSHGTEPDDVETILESMTDETPASVYNVLNEGRTHSQHEHATPRGRKKTTDDRDPEHKSKQEFRRMKHAVEQIMESKVQQRRLATGVFKKDMFDLINYVVFLLIFSLTLVIQHSSEQYRAKEYATRVLSSAGGFGDSPEFDIQKIGSVEDIHSYLRRVLVPAVSRPNMTLVDGNCTPDGGSSAVCNWTPESTGCCWRHPSTRNFFVTSGNVMMTPVKMTQLRVRPKYGTTTSFGHVLTSYPAFLSSVPEQEEARDGGGTGPDHDTARQRIDWPDRSWAKYSVCDERGQWGTTACFVEDNGAVRVGQYKASGYVANLKGRTNEMLEDLDEMEKYGWMDPFLTRALWVQFTSYLTSQRMFCVVTVLFEVSDVGGVTSSSTIRVGDMKQDQVVNLVFEYLVYGFVVFNLIPLELYKFWRAKLTYFQNGWNVMSWVNYSVFLYTLILRIQNQLTEDRMFGLVPESDTAAAFPFYWLAKSEDLLLQWNAINAMFTWIRLLRYMEAISPGTKQLTMTVAESASQLSTLMMLFCICLCGYMLGFQIAFGRQLENYANWDKTFFTIFNMILGDFDYFELAKVNFYASTVLFLTYVVIMWFIILNMILAVVMKTYDQVNENLAEQAKQEVTGSSLIFQYFKGLYRMLTINELNEMEKKVKDAGGLRMLSKATEKEKMEMFRREFLEEDQFKLLFQDDEEALQRMQVASFEELMHHADVSGEPRLAMLEVKTHLEAIKGAEMFQQDEDEEDPRMHFDIDAVRAVVEASINHNVAHSTKELKSFVQNSISTATLVISGNALPSTVPTAPPGNVPRPQNRAPAGIGAVPGGSPIKAEPTLGRR